MDFLNLKNFMDYMAMYRTPCNAVVVYLGGKPVFKYAKGYSCLENKTCLEGNEYFNIYSCSKIATVTAGLQLLEKGYFKLSDPLYEYVPEYKNVKVKTNNGIENVKNPITIYNLFTMTAGFDYNLNTPGINKAREITKGKMDTGTVIKCMAEDPLVYEPGEHWMYSKGHDVLAGFISIITGKKFRVYMQENIFEPLEMKKTVYHVNDAILSNMSEQYRFVPFDEDDSASLVDEQINGNAKKGIFKNVGKEVRDFILGDEYDSGGAGITTTADDYAKLMAALANKGTGLNGNRILSPKTVELMKTNALNDKQMNDFNWEALKGCGYGLGVRTHIDKKSSGIISNLGEFGWGGAAGATAIIDTDINLAVFYVQHCLNPRAEWYQPRLRNVVYSCL